MANVAGWRDDASFCRYPFTDDSTLTDRAGRRLPESLVVDARLNVATGVATAGAWLESVAAQGGGLAGVVRLGDQTPLSFAAATGVRAADLIDAHGRTCGRLVLGADLGLPAPAMTFAAGAATFVGGCLFCYPAAVVRSLSVSDPDDLQGFLCGQVAFVEGTGVRLSAPDAATLQVDAVGAVDPDVVDDCFGPLGDPVVSINGRPVSADGDFRFEPDRYAEPVDPGSPRQILRVDPGQHALTIGLARA